MPELPEVETIVRDLRSVLVGRRISSLALHRADILRFPTYEVFMSSLPGRRITAIDRRGKFIFCRLADVQHNGHEPDELIFHLGMTGHLLVCDPNAATARHTHLRALLDNDRELRFDDIRRFGRILMGPRAALEKAGMLPRLGVEPLSAGFDAARLDRLFRTTTRTLKATLLDQRSVAGLGNIYVDEACHAAGVRPTRRAHRLTRAERAALLAAIPAVLEKAIRNRGTTFDDYRDVWNSKGRNGEALQVYGRAGRPCLSCGTVLRSTVVAGRTTVYCASCQR
jgi:formamidopyrimidine-DNA glycosylase